ncbi:hypothetical protein HBI56_072860 [Parastagonospora nodorum]|nr:hypothetical protein HBH52_058190 [Parastagonospora nodorum]KAH3985369.1 hypothetical protein HBH51_017090 [Parastagonospora nodorum]KAH4003652.1 hypothetical protein HBI10_056270 [Parastagonospora nodorum]KAH4106545.1 hypothetical protein HBH46_065030 [Parastagonospora nodorum]KAH4128563.1 hypothetical protein HBH47_029600 [Parastagonospora nodorum]
MAPSAILLGHASKLGHMDSACLTESQWVGYSCPVQRFLINAFISRHCTAQDVGDVHEHDSSNACDCFIER